jgi:hypothetical protein
MADKITTLKTKAGDNVYPNVLEKNIPATIARTSVTTKLASDVNVLNNDVTSLYKNLDTKQPKLTAGTGISIDDSTNTISATASVPDNVVLYGDLTPVA